MNLFVVESLSWSEDDQRVLEALKEQQRPIILVLSKVDKVTPRERLLPYIDELSRRASFVEIVPLSALKNKNLEQLP